MLKSYFFLVWVLLLTAGLHAQHTLRGRVVDAADQQPLPGAHLRLLGQNYQQVSAADGTFRFSRLKPGTYQILVSYVGYQTLERQIVLDQDLDITFSLSETSQMQEEVVVMSTRLGRSSAATFTTLDRQAIRQQNSGVDLPYLLTMTPSLVVNSDAGAGIGYTGIRIRGSEITRINVTLNGVPVNDPESHGVWFVNLPDLSSSVESMQIQRGVGTSTNGSAAFGASINISTLSRSERPFAEITSGMGSFNSFRNTLNFSTGTNEKGLTLEGRLSKISSDGYIERGWSDLKSFYLAGSWTSARSLVKLMATSGAEKTYQAWNGISREMLKTNRRYNPAGEIIDNQGNIIGHYDNETDNYQQDYYQLHTAHQIDPSNTLTATAFLTIGRGYYENWKNNERFSKYGLSNPIVGGVEVKRSDLIRQKWLDNSFYGLQLGHIFEKHSVTVRSGAGINQYIGDHFGYIIWSRVAAVDNKTPWYFNTGSKTDVSLFSKVDLKSGRNWEIYGDLQLRAIDYKIEGTHDDLRNLSQQHSFVFFNPKAGITRHLGNNDHLYVQLAIANREPNRTAYRDLDPGQQVKPERLYNLESGYRHQRNTWQLETNVFLMFYKDQLVLTGKINNVGSPIMTNVPKSYRLGWENLLRWQPLPEISLAGHFSLSTNRIIGFVEYVDNWNYWDDPDHQPFQFEIKHGNTNISFSPAATAGMSAEWKPTEKIGMAFQSNFVSRQFLDNTSSKERSIEPYSVSNLKLWYEPNLPIARRTNLILNIFNIFNAKYVANGWVYRYYLDGQPNTIEGLYPQAGLHLMLQLNMLF
ncbi:MAG: TonB-dependent receptor [Bacteroidia bacterium]|nr:TonB-dependent receptor [Bacteroidia bacterium]